MLVVIDQHAADERTRVEVLMANFCTSSQDDKSSILTACLEKPLAFELSSNETNLLKAQQPHFARWGIFYEISDSTNHVDKRSNSREKSPLQILVRGLPPAIIERCRSQPRLLIDLIRTELWKFEEGKFDHVINRPSKVSLVDTWVEQIHDCPQGIVDMLNSRACRSAIMFNDELTHSQCTELVKQLSRCRFPFQCAHGRPSMVPLIELESTACLTGKEEAPTQSFSAAFRQWKRSRK